ncbi:hypothetical protein [Lactobacillus panisapium]|uniref:hypothetical protein n=1 Tax=Lactobacillus panisapium TaxID=2012495 RepID=UPI000CDAC2AC|nr:hypothetical protein [Lactobacillus panisapium]
MAKLSKQDKIEIFNFGRNYQLGPKGLGLRYGINPANIMYLLALIKHHDLAILDQPLKPCAANIKKTETRSSKPLPPIMVLNLQI